MFRNKETNLSLFIDDMIICLENLKESTNILLEVKKIPRYSRYTKANCIFIY